MIWEAKGNKVFCGLCEQLRVVHEVIGGVFFLFKGVIFPARAAIELHATSRARQAYAPSYEADAVTRGSAG